MDINAFPPPGPTTMTGVIPSYLYQQYTDDPDLPYFVYVYNSIAQGYINALNNLNLPIYTGTNITGGLLDWVATGIYGYPRPSLYTFQIISQGELNTYEFDTFEFNQSILLEPINLLVTTDDIYKRCLTWHFYKGDGKYFTIPWLKRRIQRFLIGLNGTAPNIDQTYQISVTFGPNNTVAIILVTSYVYIHNSALFDTFEFNTTEFNALSTTIAPLPSIPFATIFQAGVESGALELPFQYTWNVTIGGLLVE